MKTMTETGTFRVWIGCLACCNDGNLIGEWYDAAEAGDVETKDLHAKCKIETDEEGYLKGEREAGFSPHEELWVMDLDCAPAGLYGGMSPEYAQVIAEKMSDLDEMRIDHDLFVTWAQEIGEDFETAEPTTFESCYRGTYDSAADFARADCEAESEVDFNTWPYNHIDWDAAGKEALNDYHTINGAFGSVHVFWNE